MSLTGDIRTMLTGTVNEKLNIITTRTESRLKVVLGVDRVPKELEYISYEVALKRFNRIGNEGMSSYSQEGQAISFPDSDFDEYRNEIESWKSQQTSEDGELKRGRFRMY